jgi:hypothetical protein
VKFVLVHPEARRRAIEAVQQAEHGHVVTIKPPTRSLEQNAAMWALLSEFSERLEWPVNGRMVKMDAEDWKHVLTAAFRQETARLAMGLSGGVVMLGSRTSKMTKREFGEFLEFINAVAAERLS